MKQKTLDFMLNRLKSPLLLLICAAMVSFNGCSKKDKIAKPPLTKKQIERAQNVKINITRYEQLLFSLDTKKLEKGVEGLYGKVPEVLVAKDSWKNTEMMQSLKGYLTDPVMLELYQETQKQYPNMDDVKKQLEDAFKIYLTHFPDDSVPEVITMISGINFSVPSVWGLGNTLFLNLDMYLGSEYKNYPSAGMPKFISARCERKYIATDCFTKAIAYWHLPDKTAVTALDEMLIEGKKYFLTQIMFPSTPENDIIGYSKDKYDWAVQHEGAIWQYLIDKNMIYSKDENVVRQLVGETPFTRIFGNDSPGRLGAYIGWRIIQNYMKQHPEKTLQDLMKNSDSQRILSESLYKPALRK